MNQFQDLLVLVQSFEKDFEKFFESQNKEAGIRVGKHEADDFIDPVVAQADRFTDGADIKIQKTEQFGEWIAFGQRRENQPGE
jgi:hypothetical protein